MKTHNVISIPPLFAWLSTWVRAFGFNILFLHKTVNNKTYSSINSTFDEQINIFNCKLLRQLTFHINIIPTF